MAPIFKLCHHIITSSKTTPNDLLLSINSMATCPIHAVPVELLQEIFLSNTELDDVPPHDRLTTARHSSQVCQLWRSILLQTPRVWSRLLDLNSLAKSKAKWREVVVSRIGEAPIWMEGSIKPTTLSLVTSVLEKKWRNVQILQLEGTLDDYPTENWSFLGREAPILERIFLHFPDPVHYIQRIQWQYPDVLFDDSAPKLKEFELSSAIRVVFLDPWFSNLRTLVFTMGQTVHQIFSLLQTTPQLEQLHLLPGSIIDKGDTSVPAIALPRLEFMHLGHRSCSEAIPFLESIEPSSKCLLSMAEVANLNVATADASLVVNLFTSVLEWLAKYSVGCQLKDITLETIPGNEFVTFLWIRGPSGSGSERGHYRNMTLDVQIPFNNDDSGFMQILVDSPVFSFVSRLHLCVSTYTHYEGLLRLVQKFSSVTKLISDPKTIGALCNIIIDRTQPHFFPELHTIELKPTPRKELKNWTVSPSQLRSVCEFLEHRVVIALPVSVLNVCHLKPYFHDRRNAQIMNRLNMIDGLVVTGDD
ncbi:hypothetical protein CPC08DRAFT_714723 [Agrocybe pediades]|nr:hypothetical protein CPC08DRAFT_714723 [Agrocybe pediades]